MIIHVAAAMSLIQVPKCNSPDLCPSSDGPWQSFMLQWILGISDPWNQLYDSAFYPAIYGDVSILKDKRWSGGFDNATVLLADSFAVTPESIRVVTNLSEEGVAFHAQHLVEISELGLGPVPDLVSSKQVYQPGIIEQLQENGSIKAASWSMHLGSATHGPVNSLILGGYDRSRAIGDAAVFDIKDGSPVSFIVDIALGVEEGASPFDSELAITAQHDKSVWESLEESAAEDGAGYGAGLVNFTATEPGIYLPLNNCDTIAKYLPVVWRQDINYYAWNMSDARYQQLLSSPAYLAFVFSDRLPKNITVKVPLIYLNLTLDAPFADTPITYFPCRPSPVNMTSLGRAFLQSALLGLDYGRSLAYIAQAPGPRTGQFVTAEFPGNAQDDFQSQPLASFASSWASFWTPLAETNQTTGIGGRGGHGLSSGAIAGIVVGVVVALVTVGASAWMIRKSKKKGTSASGDGPAASELHAADKKELEGSKVHAEAERNQERPTYELSGN